jgi:hypothetical protein
MRFIFLCIITLSLFCANSTPIPVSQEQAKITQINHRGISVFLIEYENKKFLATFYGITQIQ